MSTAIENLNVDTKTHLVRSPSTLDFTGTTVLGLMYEAYLGAPTVNGYVLTSTASGVRSWKPPISGPMSPVIGETPSGTVNGVNRTFTTADSFIDGTLAIYLNGIRLHDTDDYIVTSGNSFQLVTAPVAADHLICDYLIAPVEGPLTQKVGEVPTGAINGTNLVYGTASNYQSNSLAVYANGIRLRLTLDYTETGTNTFQMVTALLTGDKLLVDYLL
jgi:hypothetical protein